MTVEAALALASITVVVVLCLGAILAVSAHVRCVDAARESARLVARGDRDEAVPAALRMAPRGARVELREEGGYVTATVTTTVALLPLVRISADAVAALEELASVDTDTGPGREPGGGR